MKSFDVISIWHKSRHDFLILISILLIMTCGILFSLAAFWSIEKQIYKEDQATFIREAEFYLSNVEKRFQAAENFLASIDRLIQMAPDLSRDDFSRFNDAEDLYELGIQAVAWSPIVKHVARHDFVTQIRETGIFDFDVRDRGDGYNPSAPIRFKYAPILFIEPIHHSGHIQGLDLLGLADRTASLKRAIDYGYTTMSPISPLSINDTGEMGFWLHIPIYKSLPNKANVEERRQNLEGFASIALLSSDLLSPPFAISNMGYGLQVHIKDGETVEEYSTDYGKNLEPREDLRWETSLTFAQRDIRFSFQRLDVNQLSAKHLFPWLAMIVGFVATFLLAGYLISSMIRTRRIEAEIQKRTKDLKLSNIRLQDEIIRREKATSEQNRAEIRYHRIFENAVEGIFAIDTSGKIVNANPSFAAIFGYENITDLRTDHADFNCLIHASDRRKIQTTLLRGKNLVNMECRANCKEGRKLYLSVNATYVSEDSDVVIEGTAVDITSRKLDEAKLNNFAYHDPLTNCLNRRAFNELLQNRFMKATRYEDWQFAVLFIDLDHFKMINDTQGHDVGDMVIQEVSNRLRTTIRESASIARLGGDEFAILLDEIKTPEQAQEIATRILSQLSKPYATNDRPFLTSGSVGIALANRHASDDPAQLMRNADLAMYQAKKEGRNQSIIYSDDLHIEADEQLKLQNALRNAVGNNELNMVYQPVLNMHSGELVAAEALIRWHNPTFGAISPDQFIPIAEEVGLINELGAWGIDRVISDMREFLDTESLQHIRMNINLSPLQLCQPDFCKFLSNKCDEYGIPRHRIAVELTETAMIADHMNIDHYLSLLTEAGFKILVDDFGTGYASLNQLTVTKWDGIKIDRNFIEGLESDPDKFAITRAVLSMAETMGYEVTAEGIETEGQWKLLLELGCQIGQGYLFGRPMSKEDLTIFEKTKASNVMPFMGATA